MSPETHFVLVTGATAGIGRAAALHLARVGHHVIATGRRPDALEALARDAEGLLLTPLRLDVTDPASIAAARAEVLELTEGHGLDVLVNNAGFGLAAPIAELDLDDLRAQFETNVFGLVEVTQAFLPEMIARRRGRILNVSSIGGRLTFPMMGAYHASKYAVEALSDALRNEVAPFGVHVVLIEPGPIKSEFADRTVDTIERYRREGSLYSPLFDRAKTIQSQSDAMAGRPLDVARAMERAIVARRPRARYVMTFSARVMLAVLSALPTWLRDRLLRRIMGLDALSRTALVVA